MSGLNEWLIYTNESKGHIIIIKGPKAHDPVTHRKQSSTLSHDTTLNKLGKERNYLNIIKVTYDNYTAGFILNE